MTQRALILVDIQKDFMPDGSLPVPDGYAVVPVANELQPLFDVVVASKDWHPEGHVSFASAHEGQEQFEQITLPDGLTQMMWPDHCIQNTDGAEFVDGLDTSRVQKVFHKGIDPSLDSYSAFFDNGHKRATGLGDWLKERGVDEVYLVGVATDVCVRYTALDAARELGFDTHVVEEGVRGVDQPEGELDRAIAEMKDAGVRFVSKDEVVRRMKGDVSEGGSAGYTARS